MARWTALKIQTNTKMSINRKKESYLVVAGLLLPLFVFFFNEGERRASLLFICFSAPMLIGLLLGLIVLLLRIGIKHFYLIPWPGELKFSDCPPNDRLAKIIIGITVVTTNVAIFCFSFSLTSLALYMAVR